MSFRIEEKLFVKKEAVSGFKEFINKQSAKKIYNSRVVESIYFENSKLQMYEDSIEGLVPRKKIRIRNYPEQSNSEHNLEIKISSVEGRFKKKISLNIDKVKHYKKFGILDDQYGICFPKLKVSYVREYYQVNDVRITIDKNILYKEYLSEFTHKDRDIIVELKTSIKKNLDDLINYFPIQKSRFSKYCNGIDILNN
jgi:hypothetical protein